jgi:hypothetical protein
MFHGIPATLGEGPENMVILVKLVAHEKPAAKGGLFFKSLT